MTDVKAETRRVGPGGKARTESATVNRWLEAIYYIDGEGESVWAARLANWMGVSQPTAGATLKRMSRDGLVEISSAKVISLTRSGRRTAASIVRKHRIAERWLTDVLDFDWVRADEEAGRLEHALSEEVAERLYAQLGKPATCPHGNPIPGVAGPSPPQRRLSKLGPGAVSTIRRISEVAEHEAPELLRFLGQSGMVLGAAVLCAEMSLGSGTLTVEVAGKRVPMSLEVASKIWVD